MLLFGSELEVNQTPTIIPNIGEIEIIAKNNNKNITKLGIVVDTSELTTIPEYDNFLLLPQYVKTKLKTIIPYKYVKRIPLLKSFNRKWNQGKIWNQWAQNYYLVTKRLSRFCLSSVE